MLFLGCYTSGNTEQQKKQNILCAIQLHKSEIMCVKIRSIVRSVVKLAMKIVNINEIEKMWNFTRHHRPGILLKILNC